MDKRNTVIIADDSRLMHQVIQEALEPAGFEIIGNAYDGAQAVELYRELRPDLILLDVIMPEMRGPAILKEILKFDPDVKAVMVTLMGAEALVEESVKLGVKGFIQKPIDSEFFVQYLKNVLSENEVTVE